MCEYRINITLSFHHVTCYTQCGRIYSVRTRIYYINIIFYYAESAYNKCVVYMRARAFMSYRPTVCTSGGTVCAHRRRRRRRCPPRSPVERRRRPSVAVVEPWGQDQGPCRGVQKGRSARAHHPGTRPAPETTAPWRARARSPGPPTPRSASAAGPATAAGVKT